MARIPGPQDFATVRPPSPVEDRSAGVEESQMANFAGSVMKIGAELKERRQKAIDSGANAFMTTERLATYTKIKNETPIDGDRPYAERIQEQITKAEQDIRKRAREEKGYDFSQSELQRQEARAANLTGSFLASAITAEHNHNISKVESQITESSDQFSLTALNNPDQWRDVVDGIDETFAGYVGTPGVSEQDILENAGKAKNRAVKNAVEGIINTDPAQALQRLESEEFDAFLTGEDKNVLLDRAKSAAKQKGTVNRARINSLIQDEIISRRTTGKPAGAITEEEIVSLAPERAPEVLRQFRLEEQFYYDTQATNTNTPEEDAALLESRAPQGVGFAEEAQKQGILQQVIRDKYKTLGINTEKAGDPAAFVAQAYPELVAGLQSDDPDTIRKTTLAILDKQAEYGVSRSRMRAITNGQAKGMVVQIESAEPKDRAGILASIQDTYGDDLYRMVYNQLSDAGLSPESKVLAANVGNELLAQQLAEIIELKPAELKAGLENADLNLLETKVNDLSAPFFQTVSAGDFTKGSVDTISDWSSVINKLAIVIYRQTGDINKAAESAVKQTIEENYDVLQSGNPGEGKGISAYVPKVLDGVEINPAQVEGVSIRMQKRELIEAFDPIPDGDPRDPDFLSKERTISTAVNSGFWVTNERGDGLILMVPYRNGQALPLTNENGERYEVDFKEAMTLPAIDLTAEEIQMVREGKPLAATPNRPAIGAGTPIERIIR